MNTVNFLSDERKNYYKRKQAKIRREHEAKRTIIDDALFIKHYGMSAFIKLFPDSVNFGIDYHNKIVEQLEKMDREKLADYLSGISLAVAATKYRKSGRRFAKMIKVLRKD